MRIRCLLLMFKVKSRHFSLLTAIVEFIEIKSDKLPLPEWFVFFCAACTVKEYMFIQLQRSFLILYGIYVLIFFSDPNVHFGMKEKKEI